MLPPDPPPALITPVVNTPVAALNDSAALLANA